MDEILKGMVDLNKNRIISIGVGGGGSNAITRLERKGIEGAITVAANTDAYHLIKAESNQKIILGAQLTEGLGAGNDPVIGRSAAEESFDDIRDLKKEDLQQYFFEINEVATGCKFPDCNHLLLLFPIRKIWIDG